MVKTLYRSWCHYNFSISIQWAWAHYSIIFEWWYMNDFLWMTIVNDHLWMIMCKWPFVNDNLRMIICHVACRTCIWFRHLFSVRKNHIFREKFPRPPLVWRDTKNMICFEIQESFYPSFVKSDKNKLKRVEFVSLDYTKSNQDANPAETQKYIYIIHLIKQVFL